MTRQKKIVFISHDSNLTGAPILLINLIRLIVETQQFEVEIVLVKGGILEKEFQKLGIVYVLKPYNYWQTKSLFKKIFSYINYKRRLKSCYTKILNADIIINNTIVNGKILQPIRKKGIPIISYIHELDNVFDYFNHDNSSSLTIQSSSQLFYPSEAVKNSLISKRSIAENKLTYLPYYFDDFLTNRSISISEFNGRILSGKAIPANKFYVVGMGTANDRKGIDIFLETCVQTTALSANVCFVWIGDFDNEKIKDDTIKKVKDNALENNFFVTGVIPYSIDNLSAFDLFFLSSREDPYPLVVLEAAVSGIPTLYFTDSGGIGEFVKQDAGWGIENFDTIKAATLVAGLSDQKELIDIKGKCAYERVKKIHSDGKSISDIFVQAINKIINR